MEELLPLLGIDPSSVGAAILCTGRYFGFLSLFPLATWLNLGGVLRACLSAGLALSVVSAGVAAGPELPTGMGTLALQLAEELVIGALLGTLLGLPVWIAQGAGDLIDAYRGASATNLLDPMNAVEVSVFGQFNAVVVQMWMVFSGAVALDLEIVNGSFDIVRSGHLSSLFGSGLLQAARPMLGVIAEASLIIAGPILILLILADLLVALLSRSAKQLQIEAVSTALKGLAILLILPFYSRFLMTYADGAFKHSVAQLLPLLGGER